MINSTLTQLLFHMSTGSTLHYNYHSRCCMFYFWIILRPCRDCEEFEGMKFWDSSPGRLDMWYVCRYLVCPDILSSLIAHPQFWVNFLLAMTFPICLFVVFLIPCFLTIKSFAHVWNIGNHRVWQTKHLRVCKKRSNELVEEIFYFYVQSV